MKTARTFLLLGAAIATLTASPALAANPLYELTSDQIARDVVKRVNEQTRSMEYAAPDFDPV